MIKLIKFHCNGNLIFINPIQVCSVCQGHGTIIRTMDGVETIVEEPLFDVTEKLTRTGKGKPIIKGSCG